MDEEPETPSKVEDTDVTEEQLKAALNEQFSALKGEFKKELAEEFNLNAEVQEHQVEEQGQSQMLEQFSTTLDKKLNPLLEKVNGLETKFAELSQEVPDQEPNPSGVSEKFSSEEMF